MLIILAIRHFTSRSKLGELCRVLTLGSRGIRDLRDEHLHLFDSLYPHSPQAGACLVSMSFHSEVDILNS